MAVVGAGPAGLAAALSGAALGLRVAVVGPRASVSDGRTAALLVPSIALLERLGAWEELKPVSAPLNVMRLVDATDRLLRAPEVSFAAHEIGVDAFGYNVPNAELSRVLDELAEQRCTRIVSEGVVDAVPACSADSGQGLTLMTAEGQTITCRIAVAADGRRSRLRDIAGISTTAWAYPQAAVVTSFKHTRPHGFVSTEFHRQQGPLTVVPGPGNTSSLVWVETPERAAELAALDATGFARALGQHLNGLLGVLSDFAPRQTFPLSGQSADRLGAQRIALIGEAAHVLPPIGAQGLNLSFRDAATLAGLVADAKDKGEDIGSESVLDGYEAARRSDIRGRVFGVDLLNRSLLSPYLPVQLMRGFGLFALNAVGPLRRAAMREGIVKADNLPALMRPPEAA